MAELFNYTGGRLGTHAVTLCKPVGGGVVDIENVPIDQANNWITNFAYYQCGETGTGPTGYCITTPEGTDCTPSPYPGQPTPIKVAAVAPAPVQTSVAVHQPTPTRLPSVGAGNDIVMALSIAVIVFAVLSIIQTLKGKI